MKTLRVGKCLGILFLLVFGMGAILVTACGKNSELSATQLLAGVWQADYTDSAGIHQRYLTFKAGQNNTMTVTLDEPGEDWYGVPVTFTQDDTTITLQMWWGLETLNGTLHGTVPVLTGTRDVNGIREAFAYRKLDNSTALAFRQPLPSATDGVQPTYRYVLPEDENDGILIGLLADAVNDTTHVYTMMNRIIDRSFPNIHSVLLIKDGKLILEEYYYGYSRSQTHRIHSVTKSVTSALIGIAHDKKLIPNTGDYAYDYFESYKEFPWIRDKYPITIDNLLSMTSGLRWQPVTLQNTPDIIKMFQSDDCLAYMFEREMETPPGTDFRYNDGNSIVLGKILEKAVHCPVKDFASEFLFTPLGITGYTWDVTGDGTARTDGGLRLRPRDMAKLGLLYLNNGRWNGRQIASETWVKDSLSRKTPLGQQEYGSHWWLKKFCINHRVIEAYCAIGHGEQFIIIVPELEMVAVFTAGNYFRTEHLPLDLMAEYIIPSIIGEDQPSPFNPDSDSIRKVTGKYTVNADERIIQISYENNALIALDPAHGKLDLIPVSKTHYMAMQPPLEVVFVEDGHGSTSYVEIYENDIKVDEFVKQ